MEKRHKQASPPFATLIDLLRQFASRPKSNQRHAIDTHDVETFIDFDRVAAPDISIMPV
jgi:hypothetical protein